MKSPPVHRDVPTMKRWTPPTRIYHKRPPTPPLPTYEQLFSDTLYSYDFDRKTWYPNIKVEEDPSYALHHLGPPPPLDPLIKRKFADYETIQFDLLKERYLTQQAYDENTKDLASQVRPLLLEKDTKLKETLASIEVKLKQHAQKYRSILDFINLQITIEKNYAYSVRYHQAARDLSSFTVPKRDAYLVVNKELPL